MVPREGHQFGTDGTIGGNGAKIERSHTMPRIDVGTAKIALLDTHTC